MSRPSPVKRRDGYEEMAYRNALQRLGLLPPVELDDIHRAYRARAKLFHPDRFAMDEDARRSATGRIQELNAAREYATRHFRWFDADQARSCKRRNDDEEGQETTWREWLALPVTAVYALAMVLVAAPFLAFVSWVGEARRERWRASRWFRPGQVLWRAWLFVGPHIATVVMFAVVKDPAVKVWFGVSLLVMFSADAATVMTGATNSLRSQRAILRLHQLVGR
ncbi:MAG TPA: J domain-containing protein [Vicinamibacteria bacterium]|nr:J domain-containing protein [Vicinamibacteria bacterium]